MDLSITLQQLQIFRTFVQTGSTTRAAQENFTSQSSVSKTLTRLEENIGVPLFDRKKGKITLTDAGRRFYLSVDRILDDLDGSIAEVQEIARNQSASLRMLGSSYLLRELAEEFTAQHTATHFNMHFYDERILRTILSGNNADLVLSTDHANFPESSYNWIPLLHCEVMAVVPAVSPFAVKPGLTLEDLKDEAFVCNNIGINGGVIRDFFRKVGIRSINLLECNDDHVFMDYLERQARCTFAPSYTVHMGDGNPNIIERRLYSPLLTQEYGFAYPRDTILPPILRDFINLSIEYCDKQMRITNEYLETMV